MYSTSHKNALKTPLDKRATEGRHWGGKRATEGRQKALFFDEDFPNAEGVRDSVSFSFSSCDPLCRYVHIPTWVRDATVFALCGDYEVSGSYDPAGGN
jgi:hypothetical protein